jgi:hypothetical protein
MKIFKGLLISVVLFSHQVNAITAPEARAIGENFINISSNVDGITNEDLNAYKDFINYQSDINYQENNLIQALDGIKVGSINLNEVAELFMNYQNTLEIQKNFEINEDTSKGAVVINKITSLFENKLRNLSSYNNQAWVNLTDGLFYIDKHNEAISKWPSLLDQYAASAEQLMDSSVSAWSISRATFLDIGKIKLLTKLNEASDKWDAMMDSLENLQAIYGNIETLFDLISRPTTATDLEFTNIVNLVKNNLNKVKGSAILDKVDNIFSTIDRMEYIKKNVNYTTPDELKYITNIAQTILKESLMDDIGSVFIDIADKVGGKKYIIAMADTRKAFTNSEIGRTELKIKHSVNIKKNGLKYLSNGISKFKILHARFAIDLGALLSREPNLKSSVFKQDNSVVKVFPDLEKNSFFNSYIVKLFNSGIISGHPDGEFKPKRKVSIGELLLMSVRAILDIDLSLENNLEKEGMYFSRYAEYLNNKNIDINYNDIKNYKNNSLDKPASRGYVAKVITNIVSYKFKLDKITYKKLDGDWDSYSNFLSQKCIVGGKEDEENKGFKRYSPIDLISRDEVSLIIVKAMEFYNDKNLFCERKIYNFSFHNLGNIVELQATTESLDSKWKKISSNANDENNIFSTYLGVNAYEGYDTKDSNNKYQCTELVKRFYKDKFGMPFTSNGNGKFVAQNLQVNSSKHTLKHNNKTIKLTYHPNQSSEKPVNGSVVSFYQSSDGEGDNDIGHVAIIKKITCSTSNKCEAVLFEQNYTYKDKNSDKHNIAFARKATFSKINEKWNGLADNKHKAVGWTIAKYKGEK